MPVVRGDRGVRFGPHTLIRVLIFGLWSCTLEGHLEQQYFVTSGSKTGGCASVHFTSILCLIFVHVKSLVL